MTDAEEPWATWDFDEAARDYNGMVAGPSPLYARYDELLDTIVRLCRAGPGKRVLDIGTGTGNLALRCLERGATVGGLDPSEAMLHKARSKLPNTGRVDLRRVDQPFLEIPFPDSHFDAVVSSYAFHHVPPPLKPRSVREMLRVIRPGGHWVIGDLVFEDERAEREALERYPWLEEEYFGRLGELRPLFGEFHLTLQAQQFTPVTWVLSARKPPRSA